MTTIIGIDCAVDPRKRGVARGRVTGDRCHVDVVWRGDRVDVPALVREAMADGSVLLALDAPLGWPEDLGDRLVDHRAGWPLAGNADALFRRRTDQQIARRLGKCPLDVGADRIARTAHAALEQLATIAAAFDRDVVPLLWTPRRPPGIAAVEVYPAGLLVAGRYPFTSGYKPASAVAERRVILDRLADELFLSRAADRDALASADILDAALCVLAGWDVLRGRAVGPRRGRERRRAGREGWIWVRAAGFS